MAVIALLTRNFNSVQLEFGNEVTNVSGNTFVVVTQLPPVSLNFSDDCSLYPDQCSADATCEEVEYLPGKNANICVCKKGFTGNGIQCIEISSSKGV